MPDSQSAPQRQLAKEVSRTDKKKAYRLGDRLEWITDGKAKARNFIRQVNKQANRWEHDPEAFADEVKDVPEHSDDERRRLRQIGYNKDEEMFAARNRASAQESQVPDKNKKNNKAAKSEKSEKKAKPEPTGEGVARQNWKGVGMCALIRYCGKKGFGKEKTLKIAEALGLEPNPATINIQLRKGQKDDDVPELNKEQREEFNATAGDIPNDAPKKKKEKPAKVAKKAKAKPTKRHQADEDEAAPDEDEAEVEEAEVEEVEA